MRPNGREIRPERMVRVFVCERALVPSKCDLMWTHVWRAKCAHHVCACALFDVYKRPL